MNQIDLRKVDLNLLVVLDVLLRERNVTAAANSLARTQSAISHALARLRDTLHDPLLVRIGGEMKPTPFAEALAPELERVLGSIARVLSQPPAFEPRTTQRHFVIAASDFALSIFASIQNAVAVLAPHASIEWAAPRPSMLRELAEGKYDLAIAPPLGATTDGLVWREFGEIDWAVFARRGNPAIRSWSVNRWVAAPHLVVRIGGDTESLVSRTLRHHGAERHIAAYVPNFSMVAPMLANSDLLATLPRIVMAEAAAIFDLVALEPPLAMPPMSHALYWGLRVSRDPAVEWLREIAWSACAQAMRTAQGLKVKALIKK